MSDELLDQLAAYGRFHRLHQEAVTVADVADRVTSQPSGDEPRATRRPRRLLTAAAVLVLATLVIALGVLATGTGDDSVRIEPGAPDSAPTTLTPPTTAFTPPVTAPGDGSKEAALLPEGVPSTPPTGELVAKIWLRHRGGFRFYADGRMIFASLGATSPAGASPWSELRLTPEGVERVRSRFLSSGVFDSAPPLSDFSGCDRSAVCVRDGAHWLRSELGAVDWPDQPPEVVRLFDDLELFRSLLPASEWVDPQVNPYVAPRIATCIKTFVTPTPGQIQEVPLDLSVVALRFPAPVADLLAGREPSAELRSHLLPTLEGSIGQGDCFELTLDEARSLVDTSLGPTGGGTHQYWRLTFQLAPQSDPAQPNTAVINFEPLLPDSEPTTYGD